MTVLDGDQSFIFIEDGPDGPMESLRIRCCADSPVDALRIVSEHRR